MEISQLKNKESLKDILYISKEKYEEIKNKYGVPKKNDILITGVGTLGTVYRINNNNPFYFKDGNLIWLKNIDINPYYLEYYLEFSKNEILKKAIGSTQKALTIKELNNLKIKVPSYEEQEKISKFLLMLNKKIELMEKKYRRFISYKRAFIQSLPLTCKEDLNIDNWSFISLSDCMFEHKIKSSGNEEVYSVSVYEGLINQIEHLGRSYSAENTSKYNLVKPGDIVYTKSPTGDFPLGIIKQSHLNKNVIVSPLYGVFTPSSYELGYIIEAFFESPTQCNNYLHPLVQKGAKNTMNITNKTFLSKKIHLPILAEEQKRIYQIIEIINAKIELIKQEIKRNKEFKKTLLSKMFC